MAKEYRNTDKTKIIWARVGMFIEVNNEDYEKYRVECANEEMPNELYERFKAKGKFGGDSYVPDIIWENNEHDVYVEGEMW